MGLLADGHCCNALSVAWAGFAPTARRRKDLALFSMSRAIQFADSVAVSGCVWLRCASWEVTLKSSSHQSCQRQSTAKKSD